MTGSFTLDDFRRQLDEISRPGLLERLLGILPGMGEMTEMLRTEEHAREVRRLGGMIDAMTPAERQAPTLIDLSRRRRIAKGSGVSPREVNELIKQYDSMASLMKGMAGGGVDGAIDTMRKLRRGEPVDFTDDDDEPWTDRDILGDYDDP